MFDLEFTEMCVIEMIRRQNGVETSVRLGFCEDHMIHFTFIEEEMRELT